MSGAAGSLQFYVGSYRLACLGQLDPCNFTWVPIAWHVWGSWILAILRGFLSLGMSGAAGSLQFYVGSYRLACLGQLDPCIFTWVPIVWHVWGSWILAILRGFLSLSMSEGAESLHVWGSWILAY